MRHLPTARGQHHKASSTTRRLVVFERNTSSQQHDLIGGEQFLPDVGTPTVGTDGWLGPLYYSLDAATVLLSNAGIDHTQLTANTWTVGLVWRRRASAAGGILAYTGAESTSATHRLLGLHMNADGTLVFSWQDSGGAIRSANINTAFTLPLNKWGYIHLTRTDATTVEFRYNGRLVDTLDMVAANSGGDSSLWSIGDLGDDVEGIAGDVNSFFFETAAMEAVSVYDDVRRAMLYAFPTTVHMRVKIADGLGALQDMTNLADYDWVDDVKISDSVDDPIESFTVNLAREIDYLSLANLVTSSKLNLTDVTDLSSYDPLVQVSREIEIDFQRVPYMFPVQGLEWQQRLHGYIDEVDWGGDGAVVVTGRDDGGQLVDDFLSDDLDMPLTSGVACAADSTTGERRASMEEAIQDFLDQWSGSGSFTLNAPSPANLCLIPWQQKKDSIMAACRACAGVKAWDFGFMYDETPGAEGLKPTLIDPGRDRVDGDGVFTSEDYEKISNAKLSAYGVRNRVFVTFGDKNKLVDTEGDGTVVKAPTTVSFTDTASKAKFGGFWRTIFVTEGDNSPIDETGEAQDMADGIGADLKDPLVQATVPINFCAFEVEPYDIHTFVGDNVHWTGDQALAVTTLNLSYANGGGGLDLGVRGKPSAGYRRWLRMESRPGMQPNPFTSATSPSHGWDLAARSAVNELVFRRSSVGRGIRVDLVRNGDFAQNSRGTSYMPEGWFRDAGGAESSALLDTVLADRCVFEENGGRSGSGLIRLQAAAGVNTAFRSDFFPVRGGKTHYLDMVYAWAGSGAGVTPTLVRDWYDQNKAFLSTSSTEEFSWTPRLTISLIDDSGPSNEVEVTTSTAHGLAVGDFFVVGATTNYQTLGVNGRGLYKVGSVISTTKVRTTSVSGGGLASEATGVVCLWQRSTVILEAAPTAARFARIRMVAPTTAQEDFYVDKLSSYEAAPEVLAYKGSDQSPITDNTWTTVNLGNEVIDNEGAFDVSTSTWTCPETGNYRFVAQLAAKVTGTSCTFSALAARLLLNGSTVIAHSSTSAYVESAPAATVTGKAQVAAGPIALVRGDTVVLQGIITRVTGTSPVRKFVGPGSGDTFLSIKQMGNE